MQLSSEPGALRTAFHPDSSTGICLRFEGDSLLIMWKGGSLVVPSDEIPTIWSPAPGGAGAVLPLMMKRALLSGFGGFSVIEYDWL